MDCGLRHNDGTSDLPYAESPRHTGAGRYPCLSPVPLPEWIAAYATMTERVICLYANFPVMPAQAGIHV